MTISNPDILLRSYQPDDAATITKIYAHYVQNSAVTFDIEAPDLTSIAAKFNTLKRAGHPLVIAECNKQLVGYAYASTFRPRPAYRFTCENAIYLAPEMAGRGVGTLLLADLIKKSRDFGFNQMVAIVTEGTENSIAIHKKLGFEVLGQFPELGFKFDKWHGVVHMQLKL